VGGQWADEDRAKLYAVRRPVVELNSIFPAVNTAIGYQLNSRMDISFRPRGGDADQNTAHVIEKVVKQISDRCALPWLETQVWSDGLIEQRGYFDVRMNFDDNMSGDIEISTLDPRDVLPDPDASSYHPDDWRDVIITRWLSLDDIEQTYGAGAAGEVERYKPEEQDFGEEDEGRNKFGDAYLGLFDNRVLYDRAFPSVRVVDRQSYRWEMGRVFVFPDGSTREIPSNWGNDEINQTITTFGAVVGKKNVKKVKWTVCTRDIVLHDAISPYPWLTTIGFFPYFRRGKTRGLIDNGISPQELLNKSASSYLHIINSSANSGWVAQENSLSNMTIEELEEKGGETGLVIEYRMGAQKPEKIQPNPIPPGVDRMLERSELMVKTITGISDAMQGLNGPEVSGVAIQSKQFMGQASLNGPIDNLNRTRHILANRMLDLIQRFYTDQRIFKIVDTGPTGVDEMRELVVNEPLEDGTINNDLTIGEYDVVVTSQPLQVTFEHGQFTQGLELRKAGIAVPDHVLIKHSNLSDKAEIIKSMSGDEENPMAELAMRQAEAQVEKLSAERDRIVAETANKAVEAQFSATQTAALIANMPQVSPMADALLLSAGYEDRNNPPIIPGAPPEAPITTQLAAPGVPMPPKNTNPLTPANPGVGLTQGIETAEVEVPE
jgi:hypothetical protein